MLRTIIDIILTIARLLIKKPADSPNSRMDKDKELAEAIRNGDSDTVGKIRERRKHYKNLIILIPLMFILGCVTPSPILTEGSKPYALPPGDYKDNHGIIHKENRIRWSLSEADLFRDTQSINEKKKIDRNLVTQGILGLIIVVALFKRK